LRVGQHGFAVENDDMHAIFIGSGPAFNGNGVQVATFDNVNVYSMVRRTLSRLFLHLFC